MEFTRLERLKLRLLADGVRVSRRAMDYWAERFDGPMTLAEYATTQGIALVVGSRYYVNAHIAAADSHAPELVVDRAVLAILDGGALFEASAIPVPAFHSQGVENARGQTVPLTNYGVTHTDRCRVSPISGCAWRCSFCDLPYTSDYALKEREILLHAITVAAHDRQTPARHALVSGGTPRVATAARQGDPSIDDEAWLDGVYEYVAANSPIPVDVMLAARRDLGHAQWLEQIGVHAVSVNLEVSDSSVAQRLVPAKARRGRSHTLRYIERAVESFGVGRVQSLMVYGTAIEPIESTLAGLRDLAERGCIPVLSPFRPHPATPLRDSPPATYDETLWLVERATDVCATLGNGVKLGPRCVPCHHNTATVPDESDFYIGLDSLPN
jgi:hypothetical protein